KFLKNKSDYINKLKEIKIKEVEFEVNKIKLYKSELTKEGPVYEVIETQPL
ncbi:RNA 2',3'-cyclic phosphodiesterase, partial [Candidatus Woesearchaeota archaeon]|nr:RNA 2',3'-cyclic phosphodiesterase [Candidatus Woesearchaeota archaeon]